MGAVRQNRTVLTASKNEQRAMVLGFFNTADGLETVDYCCTRMAVCLASPVGYRDSSEG